MLSTTRRKRNKDSVGQLLKEARVKAGFTQKGLADALGLEYYTMVSQMELGYMSIPSALWTPIARSLGLNRAEWVLLCLERITPDVYDAIFGSKPRDDVVKCLDQLDKGLLD